MYDFHLDRILLPVGPGELEVKINNQNRTLTLINEGEINMLKKPGLTDIEFTCLLPQSEYPFAQYKDGFQRAEFFLSAFEELKVRRQPFQFIVSRSSANGADTNITVSLEDYSIVEDWEEIYFDVAVQINLKQFRHFGTKEIEIIEPSADSPVYTPYVPYEAIIHEDRPDENPPTARTHTVVSGDSLWEIARKFLGNGARWGEIFDINPQIAERNLGTGRAKHTIFPGQVLTLPEP